VRAARGGAAAREDKVLRRKTREKIIIIMYSPTTTMVAYMCIYTHAFVYVCQMHYAHVLHIMRCASTTIEVSV